MRSTLHSIVRSPARLALAALVVAVASSLALTALAATAGPGPHEGAMGRHGGGMGLPMMGDARQLDRALDSVNATPEQRAQVRQIMEAAATDLKAQREAGRALRDQTMQLFAQPTVDARAAEALRQQMLAQHDQASKRTLQAMLDVSRVITPEQRKQLAERMSQRQGMMERHRAELDSLDRPAR